MKTQFCSINSEEKYDIALDDAVTLLANGEVVALPTETVYGLAADATNATAVAKIFEAKERPFFDPLIVHLPDFDWLERVVDFANGEDGFEKAEENEERSRLAKRLMEAFWPGPLTIVLPKRAIIPDLVTAGLPNVAVRMSAHPVFQKIGQKLDRPLAAPSANRFGRISPTTAAHVASELGGRIPLIVDGGATNHGVESTIIQIIAVSENVARASSLSPQASQASGLQKNRETETGKSTDDTKKIAIRILRNGPITPEQLSEFAPVELAQESPNEKNGEGSENQVSPGRLKSHYAPLTPLRLMTVSEIENLQFANGERVGLLAFENVPDEFKNRFAVSEVLSARGDLREVATHLFAAMRRLDEAGLDLIVAETLPKRGIGFAIMDRLTRAAAEFR